MKIPAALLLLAAVLSGCGQSSKSAPKPTFVEPSVHMQQACRHIGDGISAELDGKSYAVRVRPEYQEAASQLDQILDLDESNFANRLIPELSEILSPAWPPNPNPEVAAKRHAAVESLRQAAADVCTYHYRMSVAPAAPIS